MKMLLYLFVFAGVMFAEITTAWIIYILFQRPEESAFYFGLAFAFIFVWANGEAAYRIIKYINSKP